MVGINKFTTLLLAFFIGLKFQAQTLEWKTGLRAETEYQIGLSKAKELKKNVLLYFRDIRSAGCQKMERTVFMNSTIRTTLNNNYIIIYLNVFDDTPLSDEKSKASKKFKTIGDYNYDIERSTYHNETQPYFVRLDSEGKLKKDQGNTNDVEVFLKFLN